MNPPMIVRMYYKYEAILKFYESMNSETGAGRKFE